MPANTPPTAVDSSNEAAGRIYIWLEGDAEAHPPDASIPDVPGINDIDQLADAIVRGDLGRFLPVDLRYATHPRPQNRRAIRSIDTARLLRERNIRHRRRYEIFPDSAAATPDEATRPEGTAPTPHADEGR